MVLGLLVGLQHCCTPTRHSANFLRSSLLSPDFSPYGLMQTQLDFLWEVHQIRIPVQSYGELGLLHQDCALSARLQVQLDFLDDGHFQVAIDVIGNAPNYAVAVHCFTPFRKWRSSFCRNLRRARSSRDFTAASEIPTASAASSVDSPSTSRSTKTIRKSGVSSSMTPRKISLISVCAKRCSGLGPQSSICCGMKSSSVSIGSSRET